jgi:1,4-dihydroxy-2-naphthoyl-CoA hydrolase
MFAYKYRVVLGDTDAAGVIFYANQFRIINYAYEEFLNSCDMSIYRILNKETFGVPIVRAESDFLAPIRVSDELIIELELDFISNSSYGVNYKIYNCDRLCGSAKTIHVCIDMKTGNKIPLPESMVAVLKSL